MILEATDFRGIVRPEAPPYLSLPLPEPHRGLYVDPGPLSTFDPAPDASLAHIALGEAPTAVLRSGARMGLLIEVEETGQFALLDWAEFEFLYWLACGLGVGNTEYTPPAEAGGTFDQEGSDPANTWAAQTTPGGTFSAAADPVNTWRRCR